MGFSHAALCCRKDFGEATLPLWAGPALTWLLINGVFSNHFWQVQCSQGPPFLRLFKRHHQKALRGGGGNSFGVKTIPLCVVHTWAVVLHFLGPQNQWHFPPKLYTLSHAPWFS